MFLQLQKIQTITNQIFEKIRHIEKSMCPFFIHKANRVHMLVEIPPKMSVAGFVGYLKGKSSLIAEYIKNQLKDTTK